MAKKLTPIEEQEIIDAFNAEPISVLALSDKIGRDRRTITSVLQRNGIEIPRVRARRFSVDERKEIWRLYDQDQLSSLKIAKIYDCGDDVVLLAIKEFGKVKEKYAHNKITLDDAQMTKLLELWNSNRPYAEINKEMGMSMEVWRRHLEENGTDVSNRFTRENHPAWKGGKKTDAKGYVRVRLYDEDAEFMPPDKDGYVSEHKYEMAKHLGRKLKSDEQVHHINSSQKSNNNIENLQLRLVGHGAGAVYKCRSCGSIDIEAQEL